MPLRRLPIQRKLVGFIFLTTITVLVGSDLALFVYETRSSAVATSQNLETMAGIIASNSTAALVFDDPKLAQEILSGLKAEPDVTAAAIYDRYGKLYSYYPAGSPAQNVPLTPLKDGTNFGRDDFVLFKPIVQGDTRVGTLFLKSDLSAMYQRLLVYALVLLGVLSGAVLLAYIASRFLQRQISQPILNLAETAKVVTQQQDYSVRASNPTGDELGFVTEAFNSMLEQIQLNHAILGESEERFRVVADSAPVLIWIAGTDGRLTWFNKHWLTFIGMPMEQQQAGGWREAIHPDDRAHCERTYLEAFDRREYFRMECRMRRHDGAYRWLLNQGAPRHQGDEFAGFIGSCVDITDNKNAEETVRLSEMQMRLVTDYASVYLCQIDQRHRLKFVNRAYAARYGLESSEFMDRHLSDFMGKAAYERIRDRLDLTLAGAKQDFEMELPYSSLGHRWIHAVYEPQRTDDGKVIGVVAVLSDITESQRAARELERARDEAVKASRAKDDFLAALSHELRTPLNPVLLLATDAAANMEMPPDVRADFETIRKNVELEARLIDDLLDLTRITKGKMVLEKKSVAIHEVIRDAVETVREELDAREISLTIKLANGDPVVRGDPVRLQQVLWNVFKNAVKFTPERGRISITTESRRKEGILAIRVTDTGIGMSPAELGQIFEAFSQGDHSKGAGSHRFGGLGLGLAISKNLVEMHSGRITAMSDGRGCGSTFLIELPLEVLAASGPEPAGGDPSGGDGEATKAPVAMQGLQRTILLVEDHTPTRIALERLLHRRNFRVLAGASAQEARAIAKAEKIDLVISDVGLPDQSGYELMAELDALYQLKGIALSGYPVEKDPAQRGASAFSVHLVKPVSMQALEAAIASIAPAVVQA
jgi:PAS domain S-box-containing protein